MHFFVGASRVNCKQVQMYIKMVIAMFKSFILGGYCISSNISPHMKNLNKIQYNHSQTDKTKKLMTNGSFMKVESIAECSPWSILQDL